MTTDTKRLADALEHIATEMAAQTMRFSHWRIPPSKVTFTHEEGCPACALSRTVAHNVAERWLPRLILKVASISRARGHALQGMR